MFSAGINFGWDEFWLDNVFCRRQPLVWFGLDNSQPLLFGFGETRCSTGVVPYDLVRTKTLVFLFRCLRILSGQDVLHTIGYNAFLSLSTQNVFAKLN